MRTITVIRKPLSGTVAHNVITHGAGGLNIGLTRVPVDPEVDHAQIRTLKRSQRHADTSGQEWGLTKGGGDTPQVVSPDGRWPTNILLSESVVQEFPITTSGGGPPPGTLRTQVRTYGKPNVSQSAVYGHNTGSASRFFMVIT